MPACPLDADSAFVVRYTHYLSLAQDDQVRQEHLISVRIPSSAFQAILRGLRALRGEKIPHLDWQRWRLPV